MGAVPGVRLRTGEKSTQPCGREQAGGPASTGGRVRCAGGALGGAVATLVRGRVMLHAVTGGGERASAAGHARARGRSASRLTLEVMRKLLLSRRPARVAPG